MTWNIDERKRFVNLPMRQSEARELSIGRREKHVCLHPFPLCVLFETTKGTSRLGIQACTVHQVRVAHDCSKLRHDSELHSVPAMGLAAREAGFWRPQHANRGSQSMALLSERRASSGIRTNA